MLFFWHETPSQTHFQNRRKILHPPSITPTLRIRRKRGGFEEKARIGAAGSTTGHPRRHQPGSIPAAQAPGSGFLGINLWKAGFFPAAGTWGCWCRTTAPGEPRGRAEPGGGSGAQRIPQRPPPPPPGEGCAGRLRGAGGRGGTGDGAPGHGERRGGQHSEVRAPEGGRNGATKCGYGGEKMPGDVG